MKLIPPPTHENHVKLPPPTHPTCTWDVPGRKFGSMVCIYDGYNLLLNGVFLGGSNYYPLILSHQWNPILTSLQQGHPSGCSGAVPVGIATFVRLWMVLWLTPREGAQDLTQEIAESAVGGRGGTNFPYENISKTKPKKKKVKKWSFCEFLSWVGFFLGGKLWFMMVHMPRRYLVGNTRHCSRNDVRVMW